MPVAFDRIRLLPDGGIHNESKKVVHARGNVHETPTEVRPGEKSFLPVTPEGETIIDILTEK